MGYYQPDLFKVIIISETTTNEYDVYGESIAREIAKKALGIYQPNAEGKYELVIHTQVLNGDQQIESLHQADENEVGNAYIQRLADHRLWVVPTEQGLEKFYSETPYITHIYELDDEGGLRIHQLSTVHGGESRTLVLDSKEVRRLFGTLLHDILNTEYKKIQHEATMFDHPF